MTSFLGIGCLPHRGGLTSSRRHELQGYAYPRLKYDDEQQGHQVDADKPFEAKLLEKKAQGSRANPGKHIATLMFC